MDNRSLISIPYLQDIVAKVAVIERDATQIRTKGILTFYLCKVVVCAGGGKVRRGRESCCGKQAREAVWLRVLAKLHVRGKLEPPQGQKSTSLAPKGDSTVLLSSIPGMFTVIVR